MEIIKAVDQMTAWTNHMIRDGKTVCLVPTMGCFHEGHLRLMSAAKQEADLSVVSLFVNPIQFGPNEDFSCYPRVFEEDVAKAQKRGVDLLFAPTAAEMYEEPFLTSVFVRQVTRDYCGFSRNGHFDGVTTVVSKLFNLVKPASAIFGAKDYQQLTVIKQMVADLSFDIQIIEHPIVREKDGLAMSSRNRYLSAPERKKALSLYNMICALQQRVREGCLFVTELLDEGHNHLALVPGIDVEYIAIANKNTLQRQEKVDCHSIVLVAARIGQTRLIDNGVLIPG